MQENFQEEYSETKTSHYAPFYNNQQLLLLTDFNFIEKEEW